MMIPLLIIDWRMIAKTPTMQGDMGYFFLLTSVNHIRKLLRNILYLPDVIGDRKATNPMPLS